MFNSMSLSIVNSRFTIQNGYEQGLSFQWRRDAHTQQYTGKTQIFPTSHRMRTGIALVEGLTPRLQPRLPRITPVWLCNSLVIGPSLSVVETTG
jgi:hypothetical protein